MGKYYYVSMANSTVYYDHNNQWQKTETAKEMEKIARYVSLGTYEPSVLALLGVRSKSSTKKEKGFLGIEYKKSYLLDIPIPIICEDNGQYLEEVVTGKKYEKGMNTFREFKDYSKKLKLCPVQEISSGNVVKALKSLSAYELDKYAKKLDELDRAIAIGYQKDMQMLSADRIRLNDEDAYIKSFRRKYGK